MSSTRPTCASSSAIRPAAWRWRSRPTTAPSRSPARTARSACWICAPRGSGRSPVAIATVSPRCASRPTANTLVVRRRGREADRLERGRGGREGPPRCSRRIDRGTCHHARTGARPISSGVDGRVRLWDLSRGGGLVRSIPLRKPFDVDEFTPRGIAVSPDDRTLAVTHSDGTVDLIDTATLERRAVVPASGGAALALDFSPDGRLLAVGGEHGRVTLWDARTLATAGRARGAAGLDPGGRLLARRAAARRLRRERPAAATAHLGRPAPARSPTSGASSAASSLAFSPDGRLIAGAGGEQGAEVRDVRTARLVARPRTGELARSVAFSPDGRLLFVGLFNGSGQFFSTRDWRPVGSRIHGQGQRLLNPDSRPTAARSRRRAPTARSCCGTSRAASRSGRR